MDNNNNFNNQQQQNPYQQNPYQQPMNNAPYNNGFNCNIPSAPKKQSGLGTAGMVLSIAGCTFTLGLILSIADLLTDSKKTKKHTCAVIGIVFGIFWLMIAVAVNSNSNKTADISTSNQSIVSETAPVEGAIEVPTVAEPETEYTTVSIKELLDELDANALRAKETYNNQYIEITGVLSNIDASGKYISLKESEDDFSFTNIQCYIQNEDQKTKAMEYNTGDTITLKGQITDVGEIMGYSIDIVEFE